MDEITNEFQQLSWLPDRNRVSTKTIEKFALCVYAFCAAYNSINETRFQMEKTLVSDNLKQFPLSRDAS